LLFLTPWLGLVLADFLSRYFSVNPETLFLGKNNKSANQTPLESLNAWRTNNKELVINNQFLVMTLTKKYNTAFFYSEGESVIFRKPEFGAFLICN